MPVGLECSCHDNYNVEEGSGLGRSWRVSLKHLRLTNGGGHCDSCRINSIALQMVRDTGDHLSGRGQLDKALVG